jgi:ubiquinone/menaquinone biosynthesis C-methylase UbiE
MSHEDCVLKQSVNTLFNRILNRFAVNSSRVHLLNYNRQFAADVPGGAFVLDAGAGSGPYRELFAHARYESADFRQPRKAYAPTTYVCDLAAIPVENARFDFIMLNQVLEHLPEPKAVLRELNRVLKKGGRMICSAPLFYEEHQTPYDFYRYTQFAHRHLFNDTGFRIDRLEWLEGYFGTVAYQLETAARYLPVRPRAIAPGVLGYVVCPLAAALKLMFALTAILFYRVDIQAPSKGGGFPKNYVVFATKIG